MARVTRPETHTLTLKSGETLIVRKRLNAGERREMLRAMRDPETGKGDGLMYGQATVLAYLLDWTLQDDLTKEPLVIRGKERAEIAAILDSLDSEDNKEIEKAIDEWDDQMLAERREEKKIPIGKTPPEPGLISAPDSDSTTTKSTS